MCDFLAGLVPRSKPRMKIWGLALDIWAFLKTACHPKGQFDFKGVKSSPAEGLGGIVQQVVSMKEFMKPIPCQRFWRGHVIATQFVGGEMAVDPVDPVDPTKISCGAIPHRWSTQTDMACRTAFCGHSRTMGCGKGSDIGASSAGTRSKNTSSVTFWVTFSVTVASLGPASDFFSGFFLAKSLASALALAALAAKAWAASAFCFWKFFFRISRSWRNFSIRSSKSFWNSLQSWITSERENSHGNDVDTGGAKVSTIPWVVWYITWTMWGKGGRVKTGEPLPCDKYMYNTYYMYIYIYIRKLYIHIMPIGSGPNSYKKKCQQICTAYELGTVLQNLALLILKSTKNYGFP